MALGTSLAVQWLRLDCFQCSQHRFDPCSENEDPTCRVMGPKIKTFLKVKWHKAHFCKAGVVGRALQRKQQSKGPEAATHAVSSGTVRELSEASAKAAG